MNSPLPSPILVHEVEEQGNEAVANLIVEEGNVLLVFPDYQPSFQT